MAVQQIGCAINGTSTDELDQLTITPASTMRNTVSAKKPTMVRPKERIVWLSSSLNVDISFPTYFQDVLCAEHDR